jgi:hypothetical protein
MNPTNITKAGISGMFYFYIHEMYDPLFLWNIEEIKQLKIEFGNHRFIGRSLRAHESEDMWLPTLLVSPIPWDYMLADIRVLSLDKTLDIDFPTAEVFAKDPTSIVVKGKPYDDIIRPYLKYPKIVDKLFGLKVANAYERYIDDNLSHNYVLKNKDTVISVLGNKNYPTIKEYDIHDYGGLMDTILALFKDAEKEIK